MPMITDTPIALVTANCFQITRFESTLPPDSAPVLRLWIAMGDRKPDGTVNWLQTNEYVVSGEALAAAYMQPPQGETLYGAIRAALYAYAQQAGYIPAEAALKFEAVP